MKKAGFSCLFFILLHLSGYSQSNDSLKKFEKGIFISVGGNATQYYSDEFFNYLFTKTDFNKPYKYSTYSSSPVFSRTTVPYKFNYNKLVECPILNIGLQLSSKKGKKIKLNHIIETSYMKFSGECYGSASYGDGGFVGPEATYSGNVMDTVQSKYTHTVISLGYKFQPTYKFIFLSFGMNCSVNIMQGNSQRKIHENGGWSIAPAAPQPFSTNTVSDTTYNFHFINLPFQIGAGANIKINKITLRPAFYFTSCFIKGYNFYNLSLEALYKF